MKKDVLWILMLGCLVPAAAHASSYVAPQCDSCALASPIPDLSTQTALDNYGVPSAFNNPAVVYVPGDTITVCNQGYCAVYTRTADGKYTGTPATKRTGAPTQCN